MTDYKNLIKRLRAGCEDCKLWAGTACQLDGNCTQQTLLRAADALEQMEREYNASGALMDRAADAIEELSMRLHGDEAAIAGMKREIERMVVAGKPRWIPVTERLPEEWKSVLTYQPYVGDEEKPLIRVSWYIGAGSWRECERANKLDLPVTHWMPLPEPPKEETK